MSEGVKQWLHYAFCSDAVGVRNSQGKRDIKKASPSGWPFCFSVPPRRFMVAYGIHDQVGFGSAVDYRATMLQLFGTSPFFFHSFNMAELTYSVPLPETAVPFSH